MPARNKQRAAQRALPTAATRHHEEGVMEVRPLTDTESDLSLLTCGSSWKIVLGTDDAQDAFFMDILRGLLALRNYPSTVASIRTRMNVREDDSAVPSETEIDKRIRQHIATSSHVILAMHGSSSSAPSGGSKGTEDQDEDESQPYQRRATRLGTALYYIAQEGVPIGQDLSVVQVPNRHQSLPPMKSVVPALDDLGILFSSKSHTASASLTHSKTREDDMERKQEFDSELTALPVFVFEEEPDFETEEGIPSPPATPSGHSLHPLAGSLGNRMRRLSNVKDPQSVSTDELESLFGQSTESGGENEMTANMRSLRKRKAASSASPSRSASSNKKVAVASSEECVEANDLVAVKDEDDETEEKDEDGFTPSSPVIVSRSSRGMSRTASLASTSSYPSRIPPLNLSKSDSQERLLQPLVTKDLDEHDIFDFELMDNSPGVAEAKMEVTFSEETITIDDIELASISGASDATDSPPNLSALMDLSSLRLVSPARTSGNYVPIWATVLDNQSVYISWLNSEGLAMGTDDSFPLLRRADNDLVNATLILYAVGLSEQVQSVILSLERTRIRCGERSSPLFGVWIPLHRAVELATSCCIEGKMRPFLSTKLKEHFVPSRPTPGVSTRASTASNVPAMPPSQPVAPKVEQQQQQQQRSKTPSNFPVSNSSTVTAAALLSKLCQMGLLNTLVPRGGGSQNRTALASLASLLTSITNNAAMNGGQKNAGNGLTRGTGPQSVSSLPATSTTGPGTAAATAPGLSNSSMTALYEALTQILASHNQNKGVNNGATQMGAGLSAPQGRVPQPPRSVPPPQQGSSRVTRTTPTRLPPSAPVGQAAPLQPPLGQLRHPRQPQQLTPQQLHQLQQYQIQQQLLQPQHQQQQQRIQPFSRQQQNQHSNHQQPEGRATRRTIHISSDGE